MTDLQPPTHGADPALHDLFERAAALDTSDPHQWPEAALVFQANADGHPDTQLRVAIAAHRGLGWRVLIVRTTYGRAELDAFAARGAETDAGVTFETLYEWGERPATGAAVTVCGAQPLNQLGGGFDLIVVTSGFTPKMWSLHQTLSENHRPVRALLFWSDECPGDTPAPSASSPSLTVYPEPALELDYRRGDAARLRQALSCYPLGRLNWDLSKFLNYASGVYAPSIYAPGIVPAQAMLEGHGLAHPYEGLPAPRETKVARVRAVTRSPGGPPGLADLTLEWHPAEAGMYVIVPDSFPGECDVEATPFGYFAYHSSRNVEHLFHVWPAPLLRKAEADYAAAFESGLLMPQLVGAAVTTPPHWKEPTPGRARQEDRLPKDMSHMLVSPRGEFLNEAWRMPAAAETEDMTADPARPAMTATVHGTLRLIDHSKPEREEEAELTPGVYALVRVPNPYGFEDAPWLVVEGTTLGMTLNSWVERAALSSAVYELSGVEK